MTAIGSIFQTLRPCLKCGAEFYPPKRADRRIAEHCSFDCEIAAGLRVAERFYRKAGNAVPTVAPPPNRITVVPRAKHRHIAKVQTTRSRFGASVIRLRQSHGWTQQQLADRIDVSRESVRNWEHDHRDPSASHLAALAALFGVTMDSLWRGAEVARRAS